MKLIICLVKKTKQKKLQFREEPVKASPGRLWDCISWFCHASRGSQLALELALTRWFASFMRPQLLNENLTHSRLKCIRSLSVMHLGHVSSASSFALSQSLVPDNSLHSEHLTEALFDKPVWRHRGSDGGEFNRADSQFMDCLHKLLHLCLLTLLLDSWRRFGLRQRR